ncbi:MAG: sulfide/dihydroorotate dehydrogenase-like FAD/NAD-binding protein [Bacilli bacterium]
MNKIIEKRSLSENVCLIKFEARDISKNALPGQFVILRVGENGERIPFTISEYDRVNGTISIIYQVVGASTKKLDQLKVNDYILDVVGPLGRPTNIKGAKKAIVVGGGVGCAISYPVAKEMHDSGIDVTSIIGFRTKDLIILEKEIESISNHFYVTTDDGSKGIKGFVTNVVEDLLKKDKYDLVICIGPLLMMKFVSLVTKKYNTKTIVSMNSIMIDGTGMCGSCRVTVGGQTKFACKDGPDFDGHQVDFDEVIQRNSIYKTQEKEGYKKTCNLFKGIK